MSNRHEVPQSSGQFLQDQPANEDSDGEEEELVGDEDVLEAEEANPEVVIVQDMAEVVEGEV